MNSRRLISFLLVFGLLVGAVFWLKRRELSANAGAVTSALVPGRLTLETLREVSLAVGPAGEPPVRIQKDAAGKWVVATSHGAPVDLQKLAAFVNGFNGIVGEERARGTEWLDDFHLDDSALQAAFLRSDGSAIGLVVARSRKEPSVSFVRRSQEEIIYAVERDLLSPIGFWGSVSATQLVSNDWIDKRVFRFEPERVQQIEISQWDSAAGRWAVRIEKKAPIDEETAVWLHGFKDVRAGAAVDPKEKEGVFKADWKWKVVLDDGSVFEMEEWAPPAEVSTPLVRYIGQENYLLTVPGGDLKQLRDRWLAVPPKTADDKKETEDERPTERGKKSRKK
ncbi:MAG: DUF4340 domain-containing protein [Candidatus Omnitrophica bacterium]|nr:DUF4340 domain-containing protein [Candidatus Omnitrophota bacterium]